MVGLGLITALMAGCSTPGGSSAPVPSSSAATAMAPDEETQSPGGSSEAGQADPSSAPSEVAAGPVGGTDFGDDQPPSLVGMWQGSDGTVKTIAENQMCQGMYYEGGRILDIGGPATCTLSSRARGGLYTLVVQQPPNQKQFLLSFDGYDRVTIYDNGQVAVTLDRM